MVARDLRETTPLTDPTTNPLCDHARVMTSIDHDGPAPRSTAAGRVTELGERVPILSMASACMLLVLLGAVGSGSRPLGGLVMAAFGLTCIAVWLHRDGRRVAVELTAVGLLAFAISHVLGLVIGAWPSVLVVSALTAAMCWRLSDSRRGAVA